MKEDSLTTKLRIVFDGSCTTTSGVALNDILLDAPNVNADLFEALLRFRSYPVVFIADVEKMYRQVLVHPADTDYQRIVWRDSPEKPIQHFRLLTVTYGLKNSVFLAMSALKKAAEAYEQQYPAAAERIKSHTYVDDLTSGADSEEEAIELTKQINEILRGAGFVLRKWSSNSAVVLNSLTDVNQDAILDERNTIKALGTHWLTQEDVFTFKVNLQKDTQRSGSVAPLSENSRNDRIENSSKSEKCVSLLERIISSTSVKIKVSFYKYTKIFLTRSYVARKKTAYLRNRVSVKIRASLKIRVIKPQYTRD